MPSLLHEALLELFRNRPTLAPELLRDVLHVALPAHTEVRIGSADFADVKASVYHADLVALLLDGGEVGGIIVELQLSWDDDKPFSWPSYATLLRARLRRPACVLVVTPSEAVARRASEPIDLGSGNWFTPLVLGPSQIPEITDQALAQKAPELAVLSTMAHGRDADTAKVLRIATAAWRACVGLDRDRSTLYCDLVLAWLSEPVQRELLAMDLAKYEFQSEFARRYIALGKEQGKAEGNAEGKAEGKAQGRADLLTRQLTLRFGPLSDDALAQISAASIEELDAIGERLLTALSLQEALSLQP
jgi:hypothetical protein